MSLKCAHCERPHKAKGLCSLHYDRKRLGIDPDAPLGKISREGTCEGPECDMPIRAKRLCSSHYMQQWVDAPLTPLRRYVDKGGACAATGCPIPAVVEGMCRQHRVRFLAGQEDWDRPARRHAAKGSGHLGKDGYRYVQDGGRQVGEHRVVMARLLGRPLTSLETVHHLNGDRSDNSTDGPLVLHESGKLRSGNLELWSHSQPAGQEIGPKIEWARALLAQYAEFVPV